MQFSNNGDTLALIKNVTGSDISVFNPVPLSAVVDHTFTDTSTKTVGELTVTHILQSKSSAINQDDYAMWGLAVENIKNGEVGRVLLQGMTFAAVNVLDTDDLFVDVFDADTLVTATCGNAKLLGKPTSTGTGYYPVLVGGGSPGGLLIGTLDAALAHDGTQTIDSSKATVSGDWMASAKELVSGTIVSAARDDGKWIVIGANACESDE